MSLNLPGISSGGSFQGVHADTDAGHAGAVQVGHTVDEMQAIIKTIANQASTGQATWSGRASEAFGNVHTDWNQEAIALAALLDEIRAHLDRSFRGYTENDASASTLVTGSTGI